jgi:ketosteroid isomerase-like protein
MEQAHQTDVGEEQLIEIARAFNDAWNAADRERILSFFAQNAVVRIVPPPAPPDPELIEGHAAIAAWIDRTLALPFEVRATNYRVTGSVVTWDAIFPHEGDDAPPDVSEAVFDGTLITDFTP